jgi:hypothetical protein
MAKAKLIKVSTTGYSEEDFGLFTDLSVAKIEKVITPIVEAERNDDVEYNNNDLHKALVKAYPEATIHFIADLEDLEEITI